MKVLKKLVLLMRDRYILIALGFVLSLSSHSLAISKSDYIPSDRPNPSVKVDRTVKIAQNFLDIAFGDSYYKTLAEADRFYKQGNLQVAKKIQRKAKKDFPPAKKPKSPQVDISKLPPTSQKYWLQANEALTEEIDGEHTQEARIFQPIKNIVETSPEFIPGHLLLVEAYTKYDKKKEALTAIEKASELYPEDQKLLDKRIELLADDDKLGASIAARQFASSHPKDKNASKYKQTADKYFQDYLDGMKTGVGLSTGVGILGNLLTGQTEQAVGSGLQLFQGESATGKSLAEKYKSEAEVGQIDYVSKIGQKLAKLMGRDEFEYEFYVIDEPSPNAFALPGGKIFIHTGLLQIMDSEAELAGILSHELSHSVLSHSFQKLAAANASGVVDQVVHASGFANSAKNIGLNWLNSEFSRDKEKQADILGTRVLATAGYSADGIYNVMAKLKQLEGKKNFAESLLSSHPASEERMLYLEELIQTKGYNRYGYEGVQAYKKAFAALSKE